MSARSKALVIGGSFGGLFAANLLMRAGWDVEVFERVNEALADRGAGIVTHDELFAAIRCAGATVDDTIGCATHSRVTLDRTGAVVAAMPLNQILTAWGRLYRLLKDVFPAQHYHYHRAFERVEQCADGVTAIFADGLSARGDLLIGADGIRSTVRACVAPHAAPAYAGYVAWRGLADEAALSAETRRSLVDRMTFGLPPGEMMLTYLVAGRDYTTAPGQRRYNFVWYRPVDGQRALRDLFTDAQGRYYEHNIPPDRIRPDVIANMHATAQQLLAPQFVEVARAAAEPMFQPIYDLESSQLAFGRIALVGDAAFVARPHVGLGVTKAAGDALALADALAAQPEDLDAALRHYEAQRLEYGRAIVEHARLLGLGIGAPEVTGPQAALIAHLRRPEVVMREVAVPDWAERSFALRRLQVT
jgi:2-polyprenyl-6-methoxyphenol hydroxylase-like FAD-dependent oxidoreductase